MATKCRIFTIALCFAFFDSSLSIGQASWEKLFPYPTSITLASPFFINKNTGWIVGESGTILKTSDGGNSWISQNSTVNSFLNSSFFLNANLGFACGFGGTILKTTDGGVNWVNKVSSSIYQIEAIQFTDSAQGFALTTDSLLITYDGGETWERTNTGNSKSQLNLFFINDSVGWIGCLSGRIMKTVDAGNTWTEINSGFSSTYFAWLHFFNIDTGYAAGNSGIFPNYYGKIYKTTDGGANWSLIHSDNEALQFTEFINENAGYFINEDMKVFATYNQFDSVEEVYNPGDSTGSFIQIYSAQFLTDSVGYFTGSEGFIAKTINQLASFQKLNKSIDFISNSMSAPDPLHIWATDAYLNSIVVRSSNDGGLTWSYQVPDSSFASYFICFVDTLNGWIGGFDILTNHPKVGITTNGGETWNFVNIDEGESIWCMNFTDQNHGWLGTVHRVYRTIDGGNTWNSTVIDSAVYIRNMDFINNEEGWLVTSNFPGGYKRVEHSTDGGESWQIIYMDSVNFGDYFTEIDFANSLVGFLTGAFIDFKVLKTIDGGYSWNETNFDSEINSILQTGYLGDLKVASENKIWFCGGNYQSQAFIIGTENAGDTWEIQQLDDNAGYVASMVFSSDSAGWASADNGYLYKLDIATDIFQETSDSNKEVVQLFPNPAREEVTLQFKIIKPANISLAVFDLSGRKLLSKELGFHQTENFEEVIGLQKFAEGMYLVQITLGDKTMFQKLQRL